MLSAWKHTSLCLVLSALFCIFPHQSGAGQDENPQIRRNIGTNEIKKQFATLKKLIDQFQKDAQIRPPVAGRQDVATQTFQPESLILASDRDPVDIVLRRTDALLVYLKSMYGVLHLTDEENQLAQLKKDNNRIPIQDTDARYPKHFGRFNM